MADRIITASTVNYATLTDGSDASSLHNHASIYYTETEVDTLLGDYLKKDGTVPLTANWDVGAFIVTALRFVSDVAIGTSPLTVTSTTLCANLNADLLDGQEGAYYIDPANLSSAVAINKGGTGQTAKDEAFDALSPTTTKGDLIVFEATDNKRLAVGDDDDVLVADSGEALGIKWSPPAGGGLGYTLLWGGDINTDANDNYVYANGHANTSAVAGSAATTKQCVPVAGTLTKLAWSSQTANAEFVLRVELNGVSQGNLNLSTADGKGIETVSYALAAEDILELKGESQTTAPRDSTWVAYIT